VLRYVFEFCAESLQSSLVTLRNMLLHGFSVYCTFQRVIVTVGQLASIVFSFCWKCCVKWLADWCKLQQVDSWCRFALPEKRILLVTQKHLLRVFALKRWVKSHLLFWQRAKLYHGLTIAALLRSYVNCIW